MSHSGPDFDVSVVLRVGDDEDRLGHALVRVARHARSLRVSFEILVADEGSGDNSVAIAALLKRSVREIEIVHAEPGHGYAAACARARGRAVVLLDARAEAPLSALGFALERLRDGADVVALQGRYLVFRRTRAWRAFDALVGGRDPVGLERRFVRRARALGLAVVEPHARKRSWAAWRRRLLGTSVAART